MPVRLEFSGLLIYEAPHKPVRTFLLLALLNATYFNSSHLCLHLQWTWGTFREYNLLEAPKRFNILELITRVQHWQS